MVKKPFGVTRDGRAVEEIVLENETLRCSLLTYGAALRGLTAPGREGPVDVVLGFDTVGDYEVQDKFMGVVVGRYANRIAGGRFTLEGQEYVLTCNDGRKELHIGVQRRGEPSPRRANRFFLESVEGGAMRGNRRDVFL